MNDRLPQLRSERSMRRVAEMQLALAPLDKRDRASLRRALLHGSDAEETRPRTGADLVKVLTGLGVQLVIEPKPEATDA